MAQHPSLEKRWGLTLNSSNLDYCQLEGVQCLNSSRCIGSLFLRKSGLSSVNISMFHELLFMDVQDNELRSLVLPKSNELNFRHFNLTMVDIYPLDLECCSNLSFAPKLRLFDVNGSQLTHLPSFHSGGSDLTSMKAANYPKDSLDFGGLSVPLLT